MFIKHGKGFINLENVSFVELDLDGDKSSVIVYLAEKAVHKEFETDGFILYFGTKEQCQAYMTELEKELAAFGKLIRVEVD